MNKIVKTGRTLLVDGPASVRITQGRVVVFGASIKNQERIVVREGKRIPFTVEDEATFVLSLGRDADTEEILHSTIPSSWIKAFQRLSASTLKPFVLIIIGAVDSGKTGLSTYLTNRLLEEGRKVAILDGDIGQSDIGPPCVLSYAFARKPLTDPFNLYAEGAFFVGETSPSNVTHKVIEGLLILKQKILSYDPDFVIVNTDGWVDGEAVKYKLKLVEALKPNINLCLQQEDELASLVGILGESAAILESPASAKPRNQEKRKGLRELAYRKYLQGAKVRSVPLNWVNVEEDDLFGLANSLGNMRHIGNIYQTLGMKPLYLGEQQDRISIIIGRRRWIDPVKIRKVEEITGKKAIVIRKGEEEGTLVALADSRRRFLGIGVIREIDYRRKNLKILTPVQDEISIVIVGKVRLGDNLRETPLLSEDHPDLADIEDVS